LETAVPPQRKAVVRARIVAAAVRGRPVERGVDVAGVSLLGGEGFATEDTEDTEGGRKDGRGLQRMLPTRFDDSQSS
jgi:hypothetical protein